VLVATVTGHLNEWAVRLPSAIAGLLALAATINLGRRLWSREVGMTAGWLLLSSYGFLFWARTGEADMENMAATTLAVAWYWSRRGKPGFVGYMVFYLICFIGAQAKGLGAVAVPILVVLPDLIRKNRWKSYVSWSHFGALAAAAVVYLGPFTYAQMTNGDYSTSGLWMVFRENVLRYFKPFDHVEPFYTYFYYLPAFFLPWTPLFVMALWGSFVSFKQLDWPNKWLVISATLIFAFFTASGSRRGYYILPILPFCALLAAICLPLAKEQKWRRLAVNIEAGLIVPVTAAVILSPVFWPILKQQFEFTAPKALMFGTPLLGVAAMACLVVGRHRPTLATRLTGAPRELAPLIAMSVIMMGGFFCWQYSILDRYSSMKRFSTELTAEVPGLKPDDVAFFRKIPNKMLFYLNLPEPVQFLKTQEDVRDFIKSDRQTRVLISHEQYADELASVLGAGMVNSPTLMEKIKPWEKHKEKYEAWVVRRPAK
jgi:4-amino-4-deoxy-L-arabinose transferase-like glycosyltransferase